MTKTQIVEADLSHALDGLDIHDVDSIARSLTTTEQGDMWHGGARVLASAILALMCEHADAVPMTWGTFIDLAAAVASQNASVGTVMETLFGVASDFGSGVKSSDDWLRFKELVPEGPTRSCVAIDLVCEARERGLHLVDM